MKVGIMDDSLNPPDEQQDAGLGTASPGASPGGCAHQPDRDYEIGYGKPPKASQFKKGRSGNPKNRSRQVKTNAKLLSDMLDETVPATENGRKRKMAKVEAGLKQIVNRAAQGDRQSIQTVLRMIERVQGHYPKPASKEASDATNPAIVLDLPDNGYGFPRDRELKWRLALTTRDWEIEQQRKQNPGNDNYDDTVWKLRKT
jgi:Family of unknown function (DUF5681)